MQTQPGSGLEFSGRLGLGFGPTGALEKKKLNFLIRKDKKNKLQLLFMSTNQGGTTNTKKTEVVKEKGDSKSKLDS